MTRERRGRRAVRVSMTLGLLFAWASALAGPPVVVLGDGRDLHHAELASALRNRLLELQPSASVQFQDSADDQPVVAEALLVTVGSTLSQRFSLRGRPTLHTLVTANWFERTYAQDRRGASAIYIDQPIDRVVRLITTALPNRAITSLLGPYSGQQAPALDEAAHRHGLTVAVERINEAAELDGAVARLGEGGRPLLLLPDPVVVSASTAKTLLVGTYLRRTPVIGYSQAVVKAGALLAVHSTPAQLGRQAAEMLAPLIGDAGVKLPPPQFPRYFSVSANFQVARALELDLATEKELTDRLRQSEGGGE